MNKTILIALLATFLTVNTTAQEIVTAAAQNLPKNFKSDGCSLFPDGAYRHCCVEHDLIYFKGGTRGERLKADNKLFRCVKNTKGWWHKLIAPVMWAGVRVGGVSFLPTPFRWGFGRPKKTVRRCKPKNESSKMIKEQHLLRS